MSWREWFGTQFKILDRWAREHDHSSFEEEARYQAFKARLIEELAAQTDELLQPAELIEKPANPRPWY